MIKFISSPKSIVTDDLDSTNRQENGDEEVDGSITTLKVQKDHPGDLTEHQKSINLILQFINQVSQLDDKLTSKMLLRSDKLSIFLQQAGA